MARRNIWDNLTPAARITNTILLAFIINLISAEVSAHTKWADIPARLGWWMILVPISLALLVLDYRSTERVDAKARLERARLSTLFSGLETTTIKALFDVVAAAILYPKADGSLNIHIFRAVREESGRIALVKDRRFYYEREHMPSNHSLDTVYPDQDTLIICEAYNQSSVKYAEVTSSMVYAYNDRIRTKVDPTIHWVLACPLHLPGASPMGVLCAFGAKPFLKTEQAVRYFESLMIQISDIVVGILTFDRNFKQGAGDNR